MSFSSSQHSIHSLSFEPKEVSIGRDFSTKQLSSNNSSSYIVDKQQVKKQYENFFGTSILSQISQFEIENIDKQTLQHHKIKIIDENDPYWGKMINHGGFYAEHIGNRFYGLECKYDILIGRFYLSIDILNLHRDAENVQVLKPNIGEGSFGQVKIVSADGRKIAIKRLAFSGVKKYEISLPSIIDQNDRCDPFEIRQAIRQYSVYKICSMLKIGPQVIFNNIYDLVCYNNGIEFQMELCEKIENYSFLSYQQYENDMKKCTALLHSIKFVHKDIKPTNTLFSPSLNNFVLSDFGVTHSIKQSISEKAETYFQGSYHYASPQMKNLLDDGKSGMVNLYMNDVHALKISLEEVREVVKKLRGKEEIEGENVEDKSYSRNSMSFAKYSDGNEYLSNQYNDYDSHNEDNNYGNDNIGYENNYESYKGDNSYNNYKDSNNEQRKQKNIKQMKKSEKKYLQEQQSNNCSKNLEKYYKNHETLLKNEDNIKYSLQINYYLTKVLHYMLKQLTIKQQASPIMFIFYDSKISQSEKEKIGRKGISSIIREITEKMCEKQKEERIQIIEDVISSLENMLHSEKSHFRAVMLLRNTIRTFGLYSQEFYEKLRIMSQNKELLYLNQKNLQTSLNLLQKYKNSYIIKKFDIVCFDIDRHQRLWNNRSLIKSMKQMIPNMKKDINQQKNYSNDKLWKEKKKNIIKGYLYLLEDGGIQKEEIGQLRKIMEMMNENQKNNNNENIFQGNNEGGRDESNYILKQQNKELCEVIKMVYKEMKKIYKLSPTFVMAFIRVYNGINQDKIIQKILLPIIQKQWEQLQERYCNNFEQILQKVQITSKYSQTLSYYLQSLLKICHYKQTYQLAMDQIQLIEKLPLSFYKIQILDKCTNIFIKYQNFLLAEKYNQLSYYLRKQYYFPKINYLQFAYIFNYRGIILMLKKNYKQAIQNYKRTFDLLSQPIYQVYHQRLIIQFQKNMAYCYFMMNQYDKAKESFNEALNCSIVCKRCKIDQKIYILESIIRVQIKQNKKDNLMKLFQELIYLKVRMIEELPDDTGFMKKNQRRLPIFNFQNSGKDQMDGNDGENTQIVLFAKKLLIYCVEPYLPIFLSSYRNICESIGRTYITKYEMPSKALPYLWKYFHVYSKLERDSNQTFYHQVDAYTNLLISAHSERRAMKFLQQFIYRIPEEYVNIRAEGFKKLNNLSRELGESNQIFYNYIWKYRAYRNIQNYVNCQMAVNKIQNLYLRKIIQKKIRLLEDFNYRFRQRKNSRSLEDIPDVVDCFIEKDQESNEISLEDFRRIVQEKKQLKSKKQLKKSE